MRVRAKSYLCAFCAAQILLLHTAALRAQSEPRTDSGGALELGHEGLKRYEQRDFEAALARFEEAEKRAHSPVFVLYMARIHRELGRLVTAKSLFERVSREDLALDAPAVWQNAVRDAATELESLRTRVPSALVIFHDSLGLPLELSTETRSLRVLERQSLVELDPGEHTLLVTDSKGLRLERNVELQEGEQKKIVKFEPDPASEPKPHSKRQTAEKAAFGRTEIKASPRNTNTLGAYTALGLGAGALAFGGVAGVIALAKVDEIKDSCVDNRCLARDETKADSARDWANLATAGFVVGAVGVGAGLTLLFWQPNGVRTAVSVNVYPSGAALSGRF
jgi:hypothetical protein